jgi:hypothetical protein
MLKLGICPVGMAPIFNEAPEESTVLDCRLEETISGRVRDRKEFRKYSELWRHLPYIALRNPPSITARLGNCPAVSQYRLGARH